MKINRQRTVNIEENVRLLEKSLFIANKDIKIDILDSQSLVELYHFKVMSLRVHEDTKSNSVCSLLFHFIFPLIKQKTREYLKNYDWNIDEKPVQRLWLSKDTRLMMLVINDVIGTVYRRIDIDDDGNEIKTFNSNQRQKDHGQAVEWVVHYQIKRFPKLLVDKTSVPYLFSPNFTYQFDFNFRTKEFLIRVTQTQEIYLIIPHDLVSMIEWDFAEG